MHPPKKDSQGMSAHLELCPKTRDISDSWHFHFQSGHVCLNIEMNMMIMMMMMMMMKDDVG